VDFDGLWFSKILCPGCGDWWEICSVVVGSVLPRLLSKKFQDRPSFSGEPAISKLPGWLIFVIELQLFSGLPLFLAIHIATYFQMAEFFRNKLVAGHAFHSVTKVAALGILHVHPLLEPRAVCVEGVLYLREYILLRYCGLTQPYFR